ncbi:MAG TPA: hypothetical protein VIJ82_24500 [Streptosporangiaceae bacterium]
MSSGPPPPGEFWSRLASGEEVLRLAAAVAARPVSIRLADAVTEAIVEQCTDPAEHDRDRLLLITGRPALRDAYPGTAAEIGHPLPDAIAERLR